MAQSKSQRSERKTDEIPEGTYEEIHAAIQELYRLLGVPSRSAQGVSYLPGYAVYSYPSTPSTPPISPMVAGGAAAYSPYPGGYGTPSGAGEWGGPPWIVNREETPAPGQSPFSNAPFSNMAMGSAPVSGWNFSV